jgi:putative addiction module component (TIGR02574 family)
MAASLERVIEAALELTESERAELITTLISTFSPADGASLDDAWLAEISRRSAEFDAGSVQALPWAEVKENARKRQAARG